MGSVLRWVVFPSELADDVGRDILYQGDISAAVLRFPFSKQVSSSIFLGRGEAVRSLMVDIARGSRPALPGHRGVTSGELKSAKRRRSYTRSQAVLINAILDLEMKRDP